MTIFTIKPDSEGQRLYRWLKDIYPPLTIGYFHKLCRKGQIRVDQKRVSSDLRLVPGMTVSVPSFITIDVAPDNKSHYNSKLESKLLQSPAACIQFLRSITLYEDDDVLVINKPEGLATQDGSGISCHLDGMLRFLSLPGKHTPRLVHRIDRSTSGCVIIAKRRLIATVLATAFREQATVKTYWALVVGVPKKHKGIIDTFLIRDKSIEGMRVVSADTPGALRAVTHYKVLDVFQSEFAWLSLQPITGRTHQLRVHCAHIGHPILGDGKYNNLAKKSGFDSKSHLLARRIVIPHPRMAGNIDVTAPLPAHMTNTWTKLNFKTDVFDEK